MACGIVSFRMTAFVRGLQSSLVHLNVTFYLTYYVTKNIDINTFIDKLNNDNDDVTSINLDTKVYRGFYDCSHTI